MKIIKNEEYLTIATLIRGKLVLRKSTSYKNKKLSMKLEKEALILKHINIKRRRKATDLISTPKFYSFKIKGNNTELSEEFITGITVKQCKKTKLIQIYSNILDFLSICELPKNFTPQIPRVSMRMQHILLLKVLLIYLSKHVRKLYLVLELFHLYIVNIVFKNYPLVLTHGDIHPNNIIIKGKNCYLIDFSNSSYSPKGTDLAILIKFLNPTFTFTQIANFINSRIKKDKYDKRIITIMIYQALFTLAYEDPSTDFYKSTRDFLHNFKDVILPQLNFE